MESARSVNGKCISERINIYRIKSMNKAKKRILNQAEIVNIYTNINWFVLLLIFKCSLF
jgi:hypothetical protein